LLASDSACLEYSSVSLVSCSMLLADSKWLEDIKQRIRVFIEN
jgi:hypothetical protein